MIYTTYRGLGKGKYDFLIHEMYTHDSNISQLCVKYM